MHLTPTLGGLLLLGGLMPIFVKAQTAPTPFIPTPGAPTYRLPGWDPATPAGTYPAHMVFHRFGAPLPTAGEQSTGDWVCPYNLTTRPRIVGKDSLGFSFINTSSAQYDDCQSGANTNATYVGEAVLGINTTNASAVTVGWTARMWSNLTYGAGQQERIFAIELQWRPDASSAFVAVPGTAFVAGDSAQATYRPQGDAQNFSVSLPTAALNRPAAELRWIYYNRGGSTGTRPELGIDNISATATLIPSGLADEKTPAPHLRVWPVPTSSAAAIQIDLTLTEPLNTPVELLDLAGRRVILLNPDHLPAGEHHFTLTKVLKPGIYYVKAGTATTPLILTE